MREVRESMEAQRREYEDRIRDLGTQMVSKSHTHTLTNSLTHTTHEPTYYCIYLQEGQSVELCVVQQYREETKERVEELARKNQELEQETVKQRHLLQLEKLRTEKVSLSVSIKRSKIHISKCL